MKPRIAVVDDEPRMGGVLSLVLRREGYEAVAFTDPREVLAAIEADPVDLVLTDLRMPGMDGLGVLEALRALAPDLPVVLMTAHASIETAVKALKDGAFDYLQKPFDNDHVKRLVARALEVTRLQRENRYLRSTAGWSPSQVIAESPAMQRVLRVVLRVARSRSTVLVTGESGTGKEVVARALHIHSDRVARPFVAVNAKALSETLLESELFGHDRGAFTGANVARPGLFERADGGTLFFDEIGEVSGAFQAKPLRVFQEREVRRGGGNRSRKVDVRLVAATNRDLEAEVAEGRFREDLYFRLAVIPVALSALRDRPEDILPLARHFLALACDHAAGPLRGFSPKIEHHLLTHRWPGNVRELQNTVERDAVLAGGELITFEDLMLGDPARTPPSDDSEHVQDVVDRGTAAHLRAVLARAGTKSEAARRLGVDRTTLYRLMKRYGVAG